MPVRGAKPKPPGQAVNRVPPVYEWTEVEDVPFADGPVLGECRVNGQPWMARTLEKWETWRTMPHCKLWGPAEWDFALDSIELAARVHSGEPKWTTELRNREKILGTTGDFRRDLRIRYVEPRNSADEESQVTNIADYRNL